MAVPTAIRLAFQEAVLAGLELTPAAPADGAIG